ncbi:GNAT family N-acetyltransferase [Pseudonocardiaceae bacterium YIM PH 21723]|nr:GNAT family N-acetyltransferase [Pseudonocardiaceae bacterium YIM PH 21723]
MARSLGYQTDLMMIRLLGGVVQEYPDHVVARMPANPQAYTLNFLLLPEWPGDLTGWIDRFHAAFPECDHIGLGIDGTDGAVPDRDLAGLEVQHSLVLTADRLPPRTPAAEFRLLESDVDWEAALDMRVASNVDHPAEAYRAYARGHLTAMREMQRAGHGGYFAAFDGDRVISGLGIFTDHSGLARYQTVTTHPAYRNRGLAGAGVHAAGTFALDRLGARELVIVADADHHAVGVYRRAGFTDTERQLQLARWPS